MNQYKAVYIQILAHQSNQDTPSDLGCYYTLMKEQRQFVDVAILDDESNQVSISMSDPNSIIIMAIKSLTDATVVGSLQLNVNEIINTYNETTIKWFDVETNSDNEFKLQLKLQLITQEVSISPLKSSQNGSNRYSFTSNSIQSDNESDNDVPLLHNNQYVTMGQSIPKAVINTHHSPQFKQTKEFGVQVDLVAGSAYYSNDTIEVKAKYSKCLQSLQALQKEHANLQANFKQQSESQQYIKLQADEIITLKSKCEMYEREIMILRNEPKKQSQPLDNALIEQIKKLKQALQISEGRFNEIKMQLENQQIDTNQQLQEQHQNLQALSEQQREKLERYESILKLSDEQNKYILALNEQLANREFHLNQQIINLNKECVALKMEYKVELKVQQRKTSKLQREVLAASIINNIRDTQLNSYKNIVGPLDQLIQNTLDQPETLEFQQFNICN